MSRKSYSTGRVFIGRLEKDSDLLQSVTRIANEEGIGVGTVQVWGSVQNASLVRYNQSSKMNESFELPTGHDIAVLNGTISQFKGRAMARLSGVFVSDSGEITAGTLSIGTTVYACELCITELEGGTLSRDFDMETGLPLWKANSLL